MDSNYSSDDFPVHIDLGKTPDDTDMPMPVSAGKNKAPKKYYPTLYLRDISGLEDLPKDGWALIHFHRSDLSLRTPSDGEEGASAELQVKELCLPENSGNDGEDIGSAIAKALNGSGVDAGQDETGDDQEGDE